MLKNPCWPSCSRRTNTCRHDCPDWSLYEQEKFKEYAEKQVLCEQNLAYQEMMDGAVSRMKRGKRK